MTPYEIGIMLHYYCRADDHEDIVRNPPVWRLTIDSFIAQSLLEPRVDGTTAYRTTDRGRAYCEALRQVPLPEQVWITRWPLTEQEKR